MSNSIKVENLSKAYQLGEFSTGTLSRDIERRWALLRGKEDPFLKIGETNDRSSKGGSDIVWSLKDINFEIKQGDAVGIIGRNGAGKSTLLKILSRVTTPTMGSIKVKGRIASLLEVGTGFHPELTGRENIFLNGAILGMRKTEIKKHFDAIVDFAGVERYIDTPVKRYSSGMYVRLAFAVAAHLESEILIVDEVLAVGDAEFQSKCLGRMKDVSEKDGRTVLFVSHNMAAVSNLCNTGILLKNGLVDCIGKVDKVLETYFNTDNVFDDSEEALKLLGKNEGVFTNWTLKDGNSDTSIYSREQCKIITEFTCIKNLPHVELGLEIRDSKGEIVYGCCSRDNGGDYINIESGEHEFEFEFRFPAKHGYYEIDVVLVSNGKPIHQMVSKKKLQVLSKFESFLDDKWLGTISELPTFSFRPV